MPMVEAVVEAVEEEEEAVDQETFAVHLNSSVKREVQAFVDAVRDGGILVEV